MLHEHSGEGRYLKRTRNERVPSSLYRSVGYRHDWSQESALVRLDALARALPAFAREQHAFNLARQRAEEEARRAECVHYESVAKANTLQRLYEQAFGGSSGKIVRERALKDALIKEGCLHSPVQPQGVYLWGDVGSGKTTLMDILFSSLAPHMPGKSVARLHFQSFMLGVYARLHEYDLMSKADREAGGFEHPLDYVVSGSPNANRGDSYSNALSGEAVPAEGLLCFDEFQVNDVGDARLLKGCLERFVDKGVILVMTANRPPTEVDRSQLRDSPDFKEFLDFLLDRCALVKVGHGLDYREDMHSSSEQSSKSIFAVHDVEEGALRDMWRLEGGCEWDEVVSVRVRVALGRSFTARRASPLKPAVQFRLAELVDSAIGPADYLAIAQRFKTIFVTDVVLSLRSSSRDAARRWVWLIDALYAHGCRLVMRAETDDVKSLFAPDALASIDASEIAEGLQFEGEVEKKGVGADNRDISEKSGAYEVSLSTLFTGEDERFALKRAASRLLEMQTDAYRCGTRTLL